MYVYTPVPVLSDTTTPVGESNLIEGERDVKKKSLPLLSTVVIFRNERGGRERCSLELRRLPEEEEEERRRGL